MSYTVLARRYRSRTFDDIVGQDPIARTLRSAIDSNRTAHAYLFCGTRGVGKTSMARIFARELNLGDSLVESEAIGEAILRGEDLDVIEIDGASNRGVQEARDLIAASGLAPGRCRYRIYIIDEVHMLTTPAFNALLKTMEEPPSHVKFILCTTEPHKVPATIQSRCQRFDFRAIPAAAIATHLTWILGEEGIEADETVVTAVARLGDGSMRDALSLLDRLLAGGPDRLAMEDMEERLGLPPRAAVLALADAVAAANATAGLEAANGLVAAGIAPDRALTELAGVLRSALVAGACGEDSPLIEDGEDGRARAAAHAAALDEATLVHLISLCDAASRQVRRGGSGRALFDATIARLCMRGELAEAGSILKSTPASKKKMRAPEPTTRATAPAMPTPPADALDPAPAPAPAPAQPVAEAAAVLDWDDIVAVIAQVPGLRRIARYLEPRCIERDRVKVGVSDDGREMARYIAGQAENIQQALMAALGRRIEIEIDAPQRQEAAVTEDVDDDQLLNAARELFDGTVVDVRASTQEPT